MSGTDRARMQRIADWRALYLKYEGENHELIELEMRAMGHTDFHRRSMYRRFERGRCREGWIGRFCWQGMADREKRRKRDAEKSSPPGQEGCEPLWPDGVIDRQES